MASTVSPSPSTIPSTTQNPSPVSQQPSTVSINPTNENASSSVPTNSPSQQSSANPPSVPPKLTPAQLAASPTSASTTSPSSQTTPVSDPETAAVAQKDPATLDPYVIYALRPPHERAASVVPRMAKAQPDLSPANYRFSRIMSGRTGIKELLPSEYEPRFDSFASSEIASESSFALSEWTRKSMRRGNSSGKRGGAGANLKTKSRKARRAKPVLVPEYAGESAGLGLGYIRDVEARQSARRSAANTATSRESTGNDTDNVIEHDPARILSDSARTKGKQATGTEGRRVLPRDARSHPESPRKRSGSYRDLRKLHSHRSSDPRWKYRGTRLRPMPALRKIIPTGTQSVAPLKLLGIFARPRKARSDRSFARSHHSRGKRSTVMERRKSDSSPNLSALRMRTRGLPAREGGAGRRKRRSRSHELPPILEMNLVDDLDEEADEGSGTTPSVEVSGQGEINLSQAGNLSTGQYAKAFQKKIGVSREERVQRVTDWKAKHLVKVLKKDTDVKNASERRYRPRARPHSMGSTDIQTQAEMQAYEDEVFGREKESEEAEVEEESKSRSRSRQVGRLKESSQSRHRRRKAQSAHEPRGPKPTAFRNFSAHADRPRRQDSTQNEYAEHLQRAQDDIEEEGGTSGGRRLMAFAKLHLRTRGHGHREHGDGEAHGEGSRGRRRHDGRARQAREVKGNQVIASGSDAARRHSKPLWLRLIGR